MSYLSPILFGLAFGLTFGSAFFISKVVYKALPVHDKYYKSRAEAIRWEREHALLLERWSKLVTRINDKGGEAFLNGTNGQSFQMLTDKEIKTLLALCHPDKHGGNKAAEEVTRKLLAMRHSPLKK